MTKPGNKTRENIWDPEEAELSPQDMARRIESTLSFNSWKRGMAAAARLGVPPDKLRVAEVGCGTGTAALIFGLLGASVTLLDSNQKVLERTKKIYGAFGCAASFIRADCLEPAPEGLAGTFDVVLSGGLAEHFTGDYRKKCFEYHRALLRPGGMAMIGVPNRLSPFYQLVRRFRMVTGTWGPDIEVAFSNPELKALAGSAGFSKCHVAGTSSLSRDLFVYSRGLVSAIVDLLPGSFKEPLRKWKAGREDRTLSQPDPRGDAEKRCRAAFEAAKRTASQGPLSSSSDWFNSGLVLIGLNEQKENPKGI